jgi:hypothetical protein
VGSYLKDGINNYVVHNQQKAVNPERCGTKVAAHYRLTVGPGQSATVRLRPIAQAPAEPRKQAKGSAFPFGQDFDDTLAASLREADEFYKSVTPPSISPDAANVMRQALAGMLSSKQYYYWDADSWLEEHRAHPLHRGSRNFRNREWFHMVQQRRHFHARQVGISLVRRLGSRLPHVCNPADCTSMRVLGRPRSLSEKA